YSRVTSAIGALKGPLHGGANEQVMAMLTEIGEKENAIPYIKKRLENKELIMGMGHRVYRTGDPRAKHLKKMSEELTKLHGQEDLYEMSVEIEEYIKEYNSMPASADSLSAALAIFRWFCLRLVMNNLGICNLLCCRYPHLV